MTALFAALFAVSPAVLFVVVYWLANAYADADYREGIAVRLDLLDRYLAMMAGASR